MMKLYAQSQRIDHTVTTPVDRLGSADLGIVRCEACGYWAMLRASEQEQAQRGEYTPEPCPKCGA